MASVLHVRAFKDNYIWLLRGSATDRVAIVDPGDAEPVLDFLAATNLAPCAILCTHHHGDHVGGVGDIVQRYPVPVYAPRNERVHGATHPVGEGDTVELADVGVTLDVLDIPGHTVGHIAYWGDGKLFCGDTLFSAGCGRLFEGTPAQMHASLSKLAALPAQTEVYCGHEYTLANLRFALAVEPKNTVALAHEKHAESLQAHGLPTLPSTLALETSINPFLRSHCPTVRQAAEIYAGGTLTSDVAVFTVVRRWKDEFKR